MIWLPGLGMAVGGQAMLLYPIRKGTHENIVAELEAHRQSQAALEPHAVSG
jgi:GPH family glycoside/pentoside/hexuronide:cation symporter